MTTLSDMLTRVKNATVAVKEWKNEVIFLHEVRQGAADRSYGLQVAKLAGLPATVIDRANVILNELEKRDMEKDPAKKLLGEGLPLFSHHLNDDSNAYASQNTELLNELKDIYPDQISPNEALQILYKLKEISDKTDL